ncbi:MAG: molybdopterin converting factor subunit 1 [Kofleriaceae bacterium]
MRVTVLYFAVLRERLHIDEESLELAEGARVQDAISELARRHEPIATLRTKFRVAVNQDFADDNHPLAEGDELALIPPVAGGAHHVLLLETPLSLDRVVSAVSGPGMGGVVTFTGMVRDHARGKTVVRLDYSAYASMAVKEMTRIIETIETAVPSARLAVEHRVGSLAVGDLAVVIAAAAPHRAEAFDACRQMIERLKESVPIWKKEFGDDGSTWVGLGP